MERICLETDGEMAVLLEQPLVEAGALLQVVVADQSKGCECPLVFASSLFPSSQGFLKPNLCFPKGTDSQSCAQTMLHHWLHLAPYPSPSIFRKPLPNTH